MTKPTIQEYAQRYLKLRNEAELLRSKFGPKITKRLNEIQGQFSILRTQIEINYSWKEWFALDVRDCTFGPRDGC